MLFSQRALNVEHKLRKGFLGSKPVEQRGGLEQNIIQEGIASGRQQHLAEDRRMEIGHDLMFLASSKELFKAGRSFSKAEKHHPKKAPNVEILIHKSNSPHSDSSTYLLFSFVWD